MLDPVEPVAAGCAPGTTPSQESCLPAAQLQHPSLEEWWTVDGGAIQQAWTLPGPAVEGENVSELVVEATSGQELSVEDDGQTAWFEGDRGGLWRCDELVAWDAVGRMLPARHVADGPTLRIQVETEGAEWPVAVDPALTAILSEETKLLVPNDTEPQTRVSQSSTKC